MPLLQFAYLGPVKRRALPQLVLGEPRKATCAPQVLAEAQAERVAVDPRLPLGFQGVSSSGRSRSASSSSQAP